MDLPRNHDFHGLKISTSAWPDSIATVGMRLSEFYLVITLSETAF
jgi:hypothetical protein